MDKGFIQEALAHPATPGIAGAVLGAFYFMPGDTMKAKFANFTAGSACAWFVAPFAVEYFSLKTPAAQSFISFAVGMVGLALSISVWSWLKVQFSNLKWQDLVPFLRKGQ